MNRISLGREAQFLTVVITCGHPPPIPNRYRSDGGIPSRAKALGAHGMKARRDWINQVYGLCQERFSIPHLKISPFIRQMDEWWEDNEGVRNDRVQSKAVN